MLEQELAALKPFGKRLAHGLLNDTRPSETNERTRLSEVQIPEHREDGGNAAGSRICHHGDERHMSLSKPRECRAGLGHLHE